MDVTKSDAGENMKFQENLFTPTDYVIIRAAVRGLPGLLGAIVEMRFWQKQSLVEIAVELGVSEKMIERSLSQATRMLREQCLRHPAFSRSNHQLLELLQSQSAA
jgi:DNA-directed RNA polymerase specialized sigma24 family protein